MGLFSRFKKTTPQTDDDGVLDDELNEDDERGAGTAESDAAEAVDAADEEAETDEDEALLEKSAPFDRSEKGPFDISEDYPEHDRLDLGALKVPVVDGMQVRLDTDDDSQRVLAVTLIHEGGGIQLQAFATPRSEGLWNTVRQQLRESVSAQGGESDELHTSLGKVLRQGRDGRRDPSRTVGPLPRGRRRPRRGGHGAQGAHRPDRPAGRRR